MKKIKIAFISIIAAAGLVATPLLQPMYAGATAADEISSGVEAAGGDEQSSKPLDETVKDIINVMLFIVGILAVIMIIYGGIRYVISTGDQAKVTAAKNTIMYSIVGLVVAIVAYAIVNWVIGLF